MNHSEPAHQFEYQGRNADRYEALRQDDAKWRTEDRVFKNLLARVSSDPLSVLDVPVGTGRFLSHYATRHDEVVGVDMSLDMLAVASSVAATPVGSSRSFVCANATELPHPDRSFDVAVCIRLMNLIPFEVTTAILSELARVARRDVIVGIRTHDVRAVPYRSLAPLLGKSAGTKLVIPSAKDVSAAFEQVGLAPVDKVLINTGRHWSSRYHFYRLQHS